MSILYISEGIFVFYRDLKIMADIFSPYLPKDQQAFIQRMAQDNQDIFWNDAAIAVSFDEVVNRAVFWEDYIKHYPNGYFSKDARQLFDTYRYSLFIGSDNTGWLDYSTIDYYDQTHKLSIQKLAKHPNSLLAQDAKMLLNFIAMSEVERQQNYPVPDTDADGYKVEDWSKVSSQLEQALPISSPWESNIDDNRDCMSGVVCKNYNIE